MKPINAGAKSSKTRADDEHGFIAVATALLLVVLLMFTALGIDVAVWFYRGAQLQRTADAAALAGVANMPRFVQAEAAAKAVAQKNGIDPSLVSVERIPNAPSELRVTILDPKVPSFFGRMVKKELAIKRGAQAEYVAAVDLGSRLNGVGTGSFPGYGPGGTTQNFWLAINGYCTPKEYGDKFASAFDANVTSTTSRCDGAGGSVTNSEYAGATNAAYTYIVDVPCPIAGQDPCATPRTSDIRVAAYNPYFDRSNDWLDTNVADAATFTVAQVTTTFSLFDEGGTAIAAPLSFGTCDTTTCGPINDWVGLFSIPAAAGSGRFRVGVSTQHAQIDSYGVNVFSLVAYPSTQALGPCPSGPTVCPSVSGERSMSVYADVSGGQSDFFLARLSPARYYRGKKIQILLHDVDQGASSVQILGPGGAPVEFSYRTWDPGLRDGGGNQITDTGVSRTATVSPDHRLDVSPLLSAVDPTTLPWPASARMGTQVFNGRTVSLELKIPTNYGCVPASSPCVEAPLVDDGWWKIRYSTSSGTVSDRTTWTVQLVGDPVHLRH